MEVPVVTNQKPNVLPQKNYYISTTCKFFIANICAFLWLILSIYICLPWIGFLSGKTGIFLAWYIVLFIALVPGYLNMFLLLSLVMDRPPLLNAQREFPKVSVLIAAYNEEACILETLYSIQQQDYPGLIQIIVVDDGSTDNTINIILNSGIKSIKLIKSNHKGKSAALNIGLKEVSNEYIITIDADTFLHPQAIKRLMSRILSAHPNTAAVAGCVLAKNSRQSFMTKMQEWDYFLAISSVKRQQALYQGTLVAQGAFSAYKTEVLKRMKGWPACIGEDIVITWAMIKAGCRIGFESTAIGFTEVPVTLKGFARQRKRWARGMIEGFKNHYELLYKNISKTKFLIALNLLFPILDFTYTFIYIPGILIALAGCFWIAGPMTLAVLPLTLLINYAMYRYQKGVFSELKLKIRKNRTGFVFYTLFYQIIMSPVCVWGYAEEILGSAKKW